MPRILFLDHAPILGGAEAALLNLLGAIDRQVWEPLVATTAGAPWLPELSALGVETVDAPFGRLNGAGLRTPIRLAEAVSAVARLARQRQIALLHTNTVRTHIVGALAATLTGTPLVWCLHDNTFPRGLVRALAAVPQRVVAVSDWLCAYYQPVGLGHKVQVIYNGLSPARPTSVQPGLREELGLPGEARLVVNVGRLVAGKAPHLFVEAARRVAASVPNSYFALVGGPDPTEPGQAPPPYPTYLNDVIKGSGLGERLIVTGHRRDVDRFYAAADVIAYCATLPEGLPTVLLEAMRWAKPIVASAIGGAAEIIEDGRNGRAVPPGSATSLADGILALLCDAGQAQQLGDRALADLQERFSLELQADRMMQMYASLLGHHP